jgi:hypothetical protein
MNRVLHSKGLEISDLRSSLREMVPSSWAEGWLISRERLQTSPEPVV